MARRSAFPLAVVLSLSLFSYCTALLVSGEAPIPYLAAGGFGALALMVASMYGLWFRIDFKESPDAFSRKSTDYESD